MFINIAETVSVAAGILGATAIIAGVVYVQENWYCWFGNKKTGGKQLKLYSTPYDPTSPLVKRFQYTAGITTRYGGTPKSTGRYDYIGNRWY